MRKDAALVIRIGADLKKRLLKVARREGRSLSQVCAMLLAIGVEEYEESGSSYLQKTLPQDKQDSQR